MLITLHERSQITIPKELVVKLGLKTGDQLEVSEENGIICLTPVMVYKKSHIDSIRHEMIMLKEDASIDYKVSGKISDIMDKLD